MLLQPWLSVLVLTLPQAAAGACSSTLPYVARAAGACVSFPGIAHLPQGPFAIHDASPMPYFVTAPCHNLTRSQTNCTGFEGSATASPAWASSVGTCYALGSLDDLTVQLIDPTKSHAGVLVTFGNGVAGRKVTFNFTCDPDAPAAQGPSVAVGSGAAHAGYIIQWSTAAVCNPVPAPCPAVPDPKPSTALLLYTEMEMGALVCYNMATASHTQGCAAKTVPPASVFLDNTPSKADTDQWCQAIASFGGKYATM